MRGEGAHPEGLEAEFTRQLTGQFRHLRSRYYQLRYGSFPVTNKNLQKPSGYRNPIRDWLESLDSRLTTKFLRVLSSEYEYVPVGTGPEFYSSINDANNPSVDGIIPSFAALLLLVMIRVFSRHKQMPSPSGSTTSPIRFVSFWNKRACPFLRGRK